MTFKKTMVLVLLGWLAGCNGQGEADSPAPDAAQSNQSFSPVVATVGDFEITKAYFDYRYAELSPGEKQRYSGENWASRFLDKLIEEILVSNAAEEENYYLIPEVENRLQMMRHSVLYAAYYNRKYREELVPSDEEIAAYYETNKEDFRNLGRVLGYHIQTSSRAKIEEAYAALENGMRFGVAAAKFSEDENTRHAEGKLGWFNPDGYVMGLGFVKEFTDVAFETEPATYSEPFQAGDHWHIVKVGQRVEGELQSLDKVRDRIIVKLRPIIAKGAYARDLMELEARFGVSRKGEFKVKDERTAEQLFRLATEAQNPHDRIYYYDTLVEQHPTHERVDDALFMVGFLHSEEFGDVALAAHYFRRLLAEFPDSELGEDAEYMLKNLGRKQPELRGEDASGDIEAVQERIDEARN